MKIYRVILIKLNQLVWENVHISTILQRELCPSKKHFAELDLQHGGKTAGIDMIWRNYVIVTLCIGSTQLHGTVYWCTKLTTDKTHRNRKYSKAHKTTNRHTSKLAPLLTERGHNSDVSRLRGLLTYLLRTYLLTHAGLIPFHRCRSTTAKHHTVTTILPVTGSNKWRIRPMISRQLSLQSAT